MLTPFMKELTELLEKHDFEPKTIHTVSVDGSTKHVDILRFASGPNGHKVLDPVNGQPLLTRETYPLLLEDPNPDFQEDDLTPEQIMALPVGSVIAGSDGMELTRRPDGRYTNAEYDPTDIVVDVEGFAKGFAPVRLVKRGGE